MTRATWTFLRARFPFSVIISIILLLPVLFVLYVNFLADFDDEFKQRLRSQSHSNGQRTCRMTFTTTICGPKPLDNFTHNNWSYVNSGDISTQFSQAHVLFKSIALMSKFYKVKVKDQNDDILTSDRDEDCIEFIVFSDSKGRFNQLQSLLIQDESWGRVYRHLVHLTYMPVKYPPGFEDLYTMFKPCATYRLFLPLILPNLTSALYLDTDTIFLTNPKKIWKELDGFSEKNWAGMAIAGYTAAVTRYKEFHGKWGLNSGVLLLNLTRMRESQFLSQIRSTVNKFWKVVGSDQDILNIYFYYHPEEVKVLNCSQNFHFALCQKEYECTMNQEIEILHGGSQTFITENTDPFFRGIFQCFQGTTLDEINSTIHLHNMLNECIVKMRPTHMSLCNRFLKTNNIIHIKAD